MAAPQTWIITADSRRASLYACERVPNGGLHLDHVSSIENGHEAGHDQQRPTLVGGAEKRGSAARSGAHAAPHAIAPGRTAEEELERFVREVGSWLAGLQRDLGEGRKILFAPPRILGLLRKHTGSENGLEMREGDLSHLRASELAVHPAVVKAVTRA